MKHHFFRAACLVLTVPAFCVCQAQPRYTLIDIGDGAFADNASVSADGRVMYRSLNQSWYWDRTSGLVHINALSGGQLGFNGSGVNSSGTVVGRDASTGKRKIVTWDQTQGTREIIDFGSDPNGFRYRPEVHGINESGQAVGGYAVITGYEHGFFYTPGQGWHELERPESTSIDPWAVNNKGEAAGTFQLREPTLWTPDGHKVGLGFPSGGWGSGDVRGMNDQTQIVGSLVNTTGTSQKAYVWSPSAGYQILVNPYNFAYGSVGMGINARGTVVGGLGSLAGPRGMLSTAELGTRDFNDFIDPSSTGWVVDSTLGVSDDESVIAGTATHNSVMTTYVAIRVVPEPGMFVAFGAGLLAVVRRRRR